MIGSLYSGLTGLMGYQKAVDVTGNNIANQGTIAFKYGRASFSSLFSENRYYASSNLGGLGNAGLTGNSKRAGLGTAISSIDTIMTMGIIENTGVSSDVAIGGDGFFIVGNKPDDSADGGQVVSDKKYLSRVGNFEKNMFPDLIQTSTGHILYGFLGKDDGNGNIVFDDMPTEQEMIDASPAKKKEYLDLLQPITMQNLQEISAKKTSSIEFSGILDSQSGPLKKIKIDAFDNQGEPFQVFLNFSRDYSMLNNDLGTDYEAYEMGISIQDAGGETLESSPDKVNINFSPSGDLLDASGNPVNNLLIELPNGNTVNVEKGEILGNAYYKPPEVTTYADIYSGIHKESLPFTFEKIEVGDWNLKPELQEEGNIEKISLKGESGTYTLSSKGDEEAETGGIRMKFDSSGNLSTYAIVDTEGNIIDTMKSFVFDYGEEKTVEVDFESQNLVQNPLTSDVDALQKDGKEPGSLTGIEFSSSGYLMGNYSNGTQMRLGFIPLVKMRSSEMLNHTSSDPLLYELPVDDNGELGENFYGYFKPGQGLTGNFVPASLEISNVDISKEMVNLIKYQRAIQLNSRTVQTADQILQQAIQLKG